MERLTKRRIDDGEAYLACVDLRENECDGICTTCWRAGEAVDKLAAYEDKEFSQEAIKSAFTPDALIKLAAQALGTTPERLRELAAADKDGRVVVLPCKVYETDGARVYEHTVREVIYETAGGPAFDKNAIGKSIFLTRAEAERAMEARKNG
jgi:hypothetical protein